MWFEYHLIHFYFREQLSFFIPSHEMTTELTQQEQDEASEGTMVTSTQYTKLIQTI